MPSTQPRLDQVSLDVSHGIGDEVTTATADGKSWTGAMRLKAINGARKLVYAEKITAMGLEAFLKAFPEFVTVLNNVAKVVASKAGCYFLANAANSYTDATKTLAVGAAATFVGAGIANFTSTGFVGAIVILFDSGGAAVWMTQIESVTSATVVVLKNAYGGNITAGNVAGMVMIPDKNYYPRPSNVKKILEAQVPSGLAIREMSPDKFLDSAGNPDTMWPADATDPRYAEFQEGMRVLPDSLTSTANINVLLQPVSMVQDGTSPDIPDPAGWDIEITDAAVEILLSGIQDL